MGEKRNFVRGGGSRLGIWAQPLLTLGRVEKKKGQDTRRDRRGKRIRY